MNLLNADQVLAKLSALSAQRNYKAMYSSLYGGYVTQPELMIVPVDDHMVHRGDGVFEAIRFVHGKCYLLREHLERLARSAEAVHLALPEAREQIMEHCEQLRKASGLEQGMLRVFVSRGPGDFSPNPYSTMGSQLYIVVTDYKPVPAEQYIHGVSVRLSRVGVKPSPYAQIKSCNYLPNVMMKKESVDWGCDFVLGVTPDGFLAEGPTENVMIVNAKGDLVAPRFDYTLRGTTLLRAMEFARELVGGVGEGSGGDDADVHVQAHVGGLRAVIFDDLSVEDFRSAREVMMVGTTLGVLPVTEFEGRPVQSGKPGAVAEYLRKKIDVDMSK